MQVPRMLMVLPVPLLSVGTWPYSSKSQGNQEERPRHPPRGPEVPLHGFGRTVTPSDASTGPGYRAGTLVHDVGGQAHGAKIRLPHATATMKAD